MSIDCQSLLELEKQARQESHCGGEEQWCEAPQLEKQEPYSLRWIEEALTQSRHLLFEESFCHKHRINEKAFTRQRHFTFANSMLFLMQKTLRAIQTHIHSFFEALGSTESRTDALGLEPSAKKAGLQSFYRTQ